MAVRLICFDADDTLWHNECHYQNALQQIRSLLGGEGDHESAISSALIANIERYGFGAKGFTLSMIEFAANHMGSRFDHTAALRIIEIGKCLLSHPVELLDGVEETLAALQTRAVLVLVTKGDLLHQEMKLAASGLSSKFAAVNIVSHKSPETFKTVFSRHQVEPAEAVVVGDSLRSDIIPALEAGAYAAFIPHPLAWSYETLPVPTDNPRYRQFRELTEARVWIDQLLCGC